jgi:alpha-N-arabinofuranosidase
MIRKRVVQKTAQWVALTLCGLCFTSSGQNTLTLQVDSARTTINKELYGALMENYGYDMYNGIYVGTASTVPNTNGMRNDIIKYVKQAGLNVLEFPGGCFAEKYLWRNGIGAKTSRPGGDMENGMGTAEYFQLCQLAGTEGYICCDMTADSAPDMAAWLNYIDSTPAWKSTLKYWKIGNERWGGCGTITPAGTYITQFNKFRAAIPAQNSGLTIVADGGSGNNATTVGGYPWVDTVCMKVVGSAQGMGYHYYANTVWSGSKGPSIGFTVAEYYARLQMAYAMEGKIDTCDSIMNLFDPNATVGLMVDEWGAWYDAISGMGNAYQQSTVRDAIIAGMTQNIFNNHCKRVKMALVAQLVNVIQSLFLTRTAEAPTDSSIIKTPTFYVMEMYKVHQNAKMVPATLSCPLLQAVPVISASASVDSTSTLHISLTNIDVINPQALAIQLVGAPSAYQTISGQIINGPTDSSYNNYNVAETVNLEPFASGNYSLSGTAVNVTIPPHSVVMLTLAPNPTGTIATSPSQSNALLTLASGPAGKVVVGYNAVRKTSFRLTLCSVDGRVIESSGVTMEAGQHRLTWQPGAKALAGGVYIVKVQGAGFTSSKAMVLAR